jgi:hypothetical protein
MSTLTIDNRQFIEGYFEAMTSQPETEDLLNRES